MPFGTMLTRGAVGRRGSTVRRKSSHAFITPRAHAMWRRLHKAQLLPAFLLMSAYAIIAGTFGDNLDGCVNKDMCYCVNNGLRPDGVREAYC